MLDAVILGATEVDLDFNVNVTTKADGVVIGGSGGHADTAAGAKLTVVTTRLSTSGYPKIVDKVGTLTTPGETVDVVVTERGIAVNPQRGELAERLKDAGMAVCDINQLRLAAETRSAPSVTSDGPIVAISEYCDGTVIDLILQSEPPMTAQRIAAAAEV